MSLKKGVILIIVEGGSEAVSFQDFLKKIEREKNVSFHLVEGDITTLENITPKTIEAAIKQQLIKFDETNTDKLKIDDLVQIVHLVDTDGTYIDKNNIFENKNIPFIQYDEEKIVTKDKTKTEGRLERKALILNQLSKYNHIKGTYKRKKYNLHYSIYYFSRNLDHVLHNSTKNGLKLSEKMNLAYKFRRRFNGNIDNFINYMNSEDFIAPGDYEETWNFIKIEKNSLKRYSNFHLYINGSVEK